MDDSTSPFHTDKKELKIRSAFMFVSVWATDKGGNLLTNLYADIYIPLYIYDFNSSQLKKRLPAFCFIIRFEMIDLIHILQASSFQ